MGLLPSLRAPLLALLEKAVVLPALFGTGVMVIGSDDEEEERPLDPN